MINGIKPNLSTTTKTLKVNGKNGLSFDEAMDNLLVKIQENYDEWYSKTDYESKKMNLSLKEGRKFIKVVHDNSVWGFVAKVDGVNKGVPMLKGDILKAAGWRAPAKHTRGSIFDSEMHKSFSWTGPNYL